MFLVISRLDGKEWFLPLDSGDRSKHAGAPAGDGNGRGAYPGDLSFASHPQMLAHGEAERHAHPQSGHIRWNPKSLWAGLVAIRCRWLGPPHVDGLRHRKFCASRRYLVYVYPPCSGTGCPMVGELNSAAMEMNISRQAVIKTVLRQALDQHNLVRQRHFAAR